MIVKLDRENLDVVLAALDCYNTSLLIDLERVKQCKDGLKHASMYDKETFNYQAYKAELKEDDKILKEKLKRIKKARKMFSFMIKRLPPVVYLKGQPKDVNL